MFQPSTPENLRNDALEAILSRQSDWPLTVPAPTEDELNRVFAAALRAPDHGRLRPWRFILISGGGLTELGELFVRAAKIREPGSNGEHWRDKAQAAPLMIVLVAHLYRSHKTVTEEEQLLSVGAAGMNILNALHLQGFGGYWTTGVNAREESVRVGLGLEDEERIAGLIYVGTAQRKAGVKPRPPVEGFVRTWHGK